MKKYLAILLALAMVFAFAACGAKGDDETTTEPTSADVVDLTDEATEPAEDVTDATDATDATDVDASEPAEDDTTTEAASDEVKAPETTEEIIALYNEARKVSKDNAPKGHQTMKLDGGITGDGAIGAILKVLSPAAEKALAKNSKDTDWIPAADHADIKAEDVKEATAKIENGKIVVSIKFKDQVDGANGDSNDGGPVARGVGTLGSIDTALNELGAEISSGRDTVTLTYTNAYLKATIDPETKQITAGTWHYLVNVKIVDAQAKLSIVKARLENLKAAIDYTVVA